MRGSALPRMSGGRDQMVTGSDPGDHLHGGGHRCLVKQQARAREDGEEGPVGPTAHQELAGVVSLAGGGQTAAQSTMAASNVCRGNGDGGGDSGHGGSIPWPGRKSTGWRTFSARRRSSGQCLTAALGGELRLL
jgi:hypothetical protein